MDPAREARIRRVGGETKSGARKRFLVNPCRRVGNVLAWVSGKKKRLGVLLFGASPATSGTVEHPTRKAHDIAFLKNAFLVSLALSPGA